jgi:hypothetical protein
VVFALNAPLIVVAVPRGFTHLAATILSSNRKGLIADAIQCVRDWVNRILLIDTGITDGTMAVARETAGAKLTVERFAVRGIRFGMQLCAGQGGEVGAAWALTVDTDERLSFPEFATPEQLRAALDADAAVLAWLVLLGSGARSLARNSFARLSPKFSPNLPLHLRPLHPSRGQIR